MVLGLNRVRSDGADGDESNKIKVDQAVGLFCHEMGALVFYDLPTGTSVVRQAVGAIGRQSSQTLSGLNKGIVWVARIAMEPMKSRFIKGLN